MKIYGLDFTSAPSKRKPITLAECEFANGQLTIVDFRNLISFDEFEAFLQQEGEWLAGLDFPFGQPKKLIDNVKWGTTWQGYVTTLSQMSMKEFVATLKNYRDARPMGDKEHKREVDTLAGSISPMKLYGVPVGRMFFQGARRLLQSPCSIPAHLPRDDKRILLEAYPGIVARRYAGSYKSDTKSKQTPERKQARQDIVNGLRENSQYDYGFRINLPEHFANQFVDEPKGDELDAFLCSVQAAWAYTQRDNNYGIPANCDPCEGWITDPKLSK